MLFLNKLLPIFVLPLGWVFMFGIVGVIRRKRWPVIVALVLLYVCALPLVADRMLRALESGYPPRGLVEVEKADAIVVLSGFLGPSPPPGCHDCLVNTSDANERFEAGIQLWQAKKAEHLVFTGGRIPWEKQLEVEGAVARRLAQARGVPAERVLVTREVGNTDDEAHAVASMMRERGWSKVILVTTAWHMPRATRLFRKAGVDFVPFGVDYRTDTRDSVTALDFFPHAGSLEKTELVLRELYGIAFYALRR
jgi:uncharacterized SAM-binding protein YcdF (DUF218 family)